MLIGAEQDPDDPNKVELVEIQQIDSWKVEWGFKPFEAAQEAYKHGYLEGNFRFSAMDFRGAYRQLAESASKSK